MPTIHGCYRCPLLADCDIRAEKLKAAKDLGLYQIRFKCQRKTDYLKPGDVCDALLERTWDGVSVDYEGVAETEPAIIRVAVRRWDDRRIVVVAFPGQERHMISRGQQVIRHAKLWPNLLRKTGEVLAVRKCCGWPLDWSADESRVYCGTCNDPGPDQGGSQW